MFGFKKPTRMNATCVMPLTENNLKLLKMMQLNHPIPDGAKYVAFLEDGNACFLEDLERPVGSILMPHINVVTYYTDILVEF